MKKVLTILTMLLAVAANCQVIKTSYINGGNKEVIELAEKQLPYLRQLIRTSVGGEFTDRDTILITWNFKYRIISQKYILIQSPNNVGNIDRMTRLYRSFVIYYAQVKNVAEWIILSDLEIITRLDKDKYIYTTGDWMSLYGKKSVHHDRFFIKDQVLK